MIVLTAFWKGEVAAEARSGLDAYVREVHLPLVAGWPRLRRLRLFKNDGQPYEGETPRYYHCFELTYDSADDLAASLAGPERERTKEISRRDRATFRDLFEGEVLHTVCEVTTIPVPTPGPATMLRCAHYMGTVEASDRARFDAYVRDVHLPDVAGWPWLRGLRLLKHTGADFLGEPSRYYHSFELAFADQADMDRCMAADARQETRRIARRDTDSFKGLFRGEVHHANYTVTEIALRPAGADATAEAAGTARPA